MVSLSRYQARTELIFAATVCPKLCRDPNSARCACKYDDDDDDDDYDDDDDDADGQEYIGRERGAKDSSERWDRPPFYSTAATDHDTIYSEDLYVTPPLHRPTNPLNAPRSNAKGQGRSQRGTEGD
jgi:hypothetical protein